MRVGFKKHPKERGLAAVGSGQPSVDIKFNKKIIGLIKSPSWYAKDNFWRVRLTVKDDLGFRWVTLKAKFETENEAREWVKQNAELISTTYALYPIEY